MLKCKLKLFFFINNKLKYHGDNKTFPVFKVITALDPRINMLQGYLIRKTKPLILDVSVTASTSPST